MSEEDWSEAEYERVKDHLREENTVIQEDMKDKGWLGYVNQMVEDGVVEYHLPTFTYHWNGDDFDEEGDSEKTYPGWKPDYLEDDESVEIESSSDEDSTSGSRSENHKDELDSIRYELQGQIGGKWDPIFPHEFGVDDFELETYVLEDAIETVYERPDQHGEPEDSFSRIADFWSTYLDTHIDADQVAMMMALLKVARSAEGVYDDDNPRDIAGYVENYARLNKGVEE